ncbi:MAG: hypothetical protein HN353_04570 [Bdellovibrionales bacterium]|jgi:hypothetical protein|nr:hypothetical protein [Bdellovibrionales bacterium]MBT3527441.1 hypothetical protein [Bdellovibrionales bacterium]MBT7669468.1 hypothetical protein [Bdellovibrionales bacterium]MBT7767813.1 hypothetical protein [Bdellovibrionales bacterium]
MNARSHLTLTLILLISLSTGLASEVINLKSLSQSRNSIEINQGSYDGIHVGDTAKFTFTHGGELPTSTTGTAWGEAIEVNGRSSFGLLTNMSKRWLSDPNPTTKLIFRKDLVSARKFFTLEPPPPPPLEEEGFDQIQSLQSYQDTLTGDETNIANLLSKATDYSNLQPSKWNQKRYKYDVDKTGKRVRHPYKEERSAIIQRSISKKLVQDNLFYPTRKADIFDDALIRQERIKASFMNSGITQERKRQNYLVHHKKSHEFLLNYGQSLLYNTSLDDPNFNISGYSIVIGYELLLERLNIRWRNWTLRANYRSSTNYYNIAGANAKSDERSLQFVLNWYPYHNPTALLKPLLYIGAGAGMGAASITPSSGATTNQPTWSYAIYQIPVLITGVKYRFGSGDGLIEIIPFGMALHLAISYQLIMLSPANQLPNGIDGAISTNDIKLISGLSFYF